LVTAKQAAVYLGVVVCDGRLAGNFTDEVWTPASEGNIKKVKEAAKGACLEI
jgi:hypothetical protein